jgi:hypothetical protein
MEVVITPDEWFDVPLYQPKKEPLDTSPSEIQPPGVDQEEEKTMHQKMYEFATKNGTTLTLGGSENASRV